MRAIALTVCMILGGILTTAPQAGEKKPRLRVCLISGAAEYDSDMTMPILQKYLESKYDVVCSRAFAKSETNLPGLENLEKCDVVVLFARRLKLKDDELERIKKYCLSGKPLVGIRTASHAIQTWLDLDHEVFGGNYKNHYKAGVLTEIKIADGAKDNPILKGVRPYKSEASLYRNTGLSNDVHILLTGSIPEGTEPIAWTRMYKKGRVFYTSLGHQKDFEEESFLHLVSNAILWTTHREAQIK